MEHETHRHKARTHATNKTDPRRTRATDKAEERGAPLRPLCVAEQSVSNLHANFVFLTSFSAFSPFVLRGSPRVG